MTPRFGHRAWHRVWHRVWALALAATLAPMPSAAAAPKGKTKQKAKVETPAPDPEPEEILVIEEEEPEAPEESLPDTRPPAQAIIEDMALVGDGKIEDPQIAMSKLRELLAKAEAYPFEVADELGAHRARVRALLALAQLLIESGDVDGAIANIDEAIRVVRGDPLPPGIGPALEQLIFERLAAPENAHRGSLQVRCRVPCRVVLDERDVGRGSEISARGLPLGRHRLHIRTLAPPAFNETHTVLLTDEHARFEHRFEGPPTVAQQTLNDPTDTPSFRRHRPQDPTWKMPRWTSIAGIAAGSALVVSGALLMAFHGRCFDLTDPKLEPHCPDVLDTRWAGAGLAIGGSAMIIAFSITLGIGDYRGRRAYERQMQARMGWREPASAPAPWAPQLRF